MFLIALSLCNSKTLAQIKSNSMSIRRRMVLLSPIPISAVLLKYYLMSTYCVPGIELYTENSTIRQRRSLPSQIPWLWQYKLIVCTCPWIDSVYNFRKFKCLRTSRASSLNANGWGEAGRADWFFFLSLNIKVHIFRVKEKKKLLFSLASLPSRMMGDFIYLGVFLFVVFVFVFGFLFICIFLFWSSCPFSKMKKILEMDAVCLWAHNNVNTFNATELYFQKWLKWQISWHVQLTTIKNKGKFF